MTASLRSRLPDIPFFGLAAFVTTVLAMPLIKDGYSPVEERISQGALGEFGYIQVFGILALAGASSSVAFQLGNSCRTRCLQVTTALIMASAAGLAFVAAIPTDRPGTDSIPGNIHLVLAVAAFIVNVAAMLLAAYAFRRDPRLGPLALPSLILAVASILLLSAMGLGIGPAGLVQRMAASCHIAWLALLAWRLRLETSEGAIDALPGWPARAPR